MAFSVKFLIFLDNQFILNLDFSGQGCQAGQLFPEPQARPSAESRLPVCLGHQDSCRQQGKVYTRWRVKCWFLILKAIVSADWLRFVT